MLDTSEDLVSVWMADAKHGPAIENASSVVRYLAKNLFHDYEPCQFGTFNIRLDRWLGNVDSSEDKRLLYQLIPHIFFLGRKEFEALYRGAFKRLVANWLIDRAGIHFGDTNAAERLLGAVERTWFCAITDSMRINAFYHANMIKGRDHRPDWRSLKKFGSVTKIEEYIGDEGIDGLVLLEDFVATGDQMAETVEFAAGLKSGALPVLVIPLVICPEGVTRGEQIRKDNSNVTFSPAFQLPNGAFDRRSPQPDEPELFPKIRALALDVRQRVFNDTGIPDGFAFGYGETGGLIVMYSNCPDNTLPLIYYKSATWNPLFPRSTRV